MRRLDISDPENHIRRRFKEEDLTFVGNVCVGPTLIDQIDAAIDDALMTGTWVDIYVSNQFCNRFLQPSFYKF